MKRTLLGLAAVAAAFGAMAQAENPANKIVETFEVAQSTPQGPTSGSNSTASSDSGAGIKMRGPLAYPGNTWGTLVYGVYRPNGDTTPRWRVEGIVEQGIDWFRFADNTWKFNTYGAIEYVLNDNDKSWTPVLGVKVNKRFTDGSLDLGMRYKYGNTYISPSGSFMGGQERKSRVELYATYWFDWNLKKD